MNGQGEPRRRDIRGALGKKTKNPLDDWCDKPNLAIHLGVEDETITDWQKKEGLPFAKIGRITLFSLKQIDKFLNARMMTLYPEGKQQKKAQKKVDMKKGAGVDETRAN